MARIVVGIYLLEEYANGASLPFSLNFQDNTRVCCHVCIIIREAKSIRVVSSRADSHGNHQRVILHCILYEGAKIGMLHLEWGTEFILTARRATTGDILLQHNVAAMDLDFTWTLKLRLSDHMGTSSPFELRILQGTAELDDSQRLRPTMFRFHLLPSAGQLRVILFHTAGRKVRKCICQLMPHDKDRFAPPNIGLNSSRTLIFS